MCVGCSGCLQQVNPVQFDTSAYLRKATSRAKSDVANKLISMLLHEISRRMVATIGMGVTDAKYTAAVAETFGDRCGYCQRVLEADRAMVEHLDGMNRFRIGLHIPGNVVVACKRCNNAKRLDDQRESLVLAESGWESFLSHDGMRCLPVCKTCAYWQTVWPGVEQRNAALSAALHRIRTFRGLYADSTQWGARARSFLKDKINAVYRNCQASANAQIQEMAADLFRELG